MLWLMLVGCGSDKVEETATATEPVASERVAVDPKSGLGAVESARTRQAIELPVEPAPIDPEVTSEGVGFIRHDTTRAAIVEALGEEAVTEHRFDQGEGMFAPGIALLVGTPFELHLQTDGQTVERVEIVGDRYHLGDGVKVGSSFADLEAARGDFEIFGFGWDYGGTLVAKDFAPPGFQIAVRTEPTEREGHAWSPAAKEVLRGGDRHFPSSNPGVAELAPHVTSIVLVWREAPRKRPAKK